MLKTIDLFAGCGGFSLGFLQAGYSVDYAVEINPQIAETYKINHPQTHVLIDDIKNIDESKFFDNKKVDVIIGGPPCQGFSMAGARIRNGFISDPRNFLFKHYFHIVKQVSPKIFLIENVKGILTMEQGSIFNEILDSFEKIGYHVQYKIIKAKDIGIPQDRERVIITGTKEKIDNLDDLFDRAKKNILSEIPSFFTKSTVWDAISNLSESQSESLKKEIPILTPKTEYQKYLSNNNSTVYNHTKTNHSETAINRMKQIRCNENFRVLEEKINSVHSGSYGRLDPNGISPTITTRFDTPSGGKFIHPIHHRTLTPREAARIQSFPDDFIFTGTKTSICTQIGNAVPPKIGYYLAQVVKEILRNSY